MFSGAFSQLRDAPSGATGPHGRDDAPVKNALRPIHGQEVDLSLKFSILALTFKEFRNSGYSSESSFSFKI